MPRAHTHPLRSRAVASTSLLAAWQEPVYRLRPPRASRDWRLYFLPFFLPCLAAVKGAAAAGADSGAAAAFFLVAELFAAAACLVVARVGAAVAPVLLERRGVVDFEVALARVVRAGDEVLRRAGLAPRWPLSTTRRTPGPGTNLVSSPESHRTVMRDPLSPVTTPVRETWPAFEGNTSTRSPITGMTRPPPSGGVSIAHP